MPDLPLTVERGLALRASEPVTVPIGVRRLDPAAVLPAYALPGDAGADLCSVEAIDLPPGHRAVVRTGIAIGLPEGYAGFVHPRSGLAARHGVTVVNAPGTIDSGYRGEIKVTLLNTDLTETVRLRPGDRIAQLVVQRVELAGFVEVDTLDRTERGESGFGSTGGFTAGGFSKESGQE